MKQLIKLNLNSLALLFIATFWQIIAFAQDSGSGGSVTTTTKTTTGSSSMNTSSATTTDEWYTQPWVWVVAGAILILLIVALVRGNSTGTSDKVTVTKTVKRDVE